MICPRCEDDVMTTRKFVSDSDPLHSIDVCLGCGKDLEDDYLLRDAYFAMLRSQARQAACDDVLKESCVDKREQGPSAVAAIRPDNSVPFLLEDLLAADAD